MNSLSWPNQTRNTRLITLARAFHAFGFNLIALDSHKKPLGKWKSNPNWTVSRQTFQEMLRQNWRSARRIAAICGRVSGGLIGLDFDKQQGRSLVNFFLIALGLPLDYAWFEQTPGGGYHVWVRCPDLIPPDDARGGRVDRVGWQQAGRSGKRRLQLSSRRQGHVYRHPFYRP